MKKCGRLVIRQKWKVNGVVLPDELDYKLIYRYDTLKDFIEQEGLSRSTVYNRIYSLSKNCLDSKFHRLKPTERLTYLRYSPKTILYFVVSVILSIITDEEISNEILQKFKQVI